MQNRTSLQSSLLQAILFLTSWFEYVSSIDTHPVFAGDDYRLAAPGHFTLLSVLCASARVTAGNALGVLLQTQYVAAQLVSEELFKAEMTTIIENWKSNTIAKYLRTIQLVREMHYGNQLSTLFLLIM